MEHVPMLLGIGMATVVTVLLGSAAIVVCWTGARPGKPWGIPLLTLLVMAAAGAVLLEKRPAEQNMQRERPRFQSARLMGKGLRGELSEGDRILIFRYPVPTETMPEGSLPQPEKADTPDMPTVETQEMKMRENWEKALEEGAGVDIEIVACEVPDMPENTLLNREHPGNATAFSNVLDTYRDEKIDAWISFVGVPRTMEGEVALQNVRGYNAPNPPLVAAELDIYYDPDTVRRWIEEGLLNAAIIHPSARTSEMVVITKNNVDELPEEPPMPSSPQPSQ